MTAPYRIRLHRNDAAKWAVLNPILLEGEPGYETDTGKLKMGDGSSRWLELDYFLPSREIQTAIADAIAQAGAGSGSTAGPALVDHIYSATPHPAYDDGPSLALLYQNAKV